MTDRKSRRVVIINNINSETIDQAIFILKSDKKDIVQSRGTEGDIVREAQEIINNYIRRVERFKSPTADIRKKKKKNLGITFATLCVAAMLGIVFYVVR